MAGPWVEGPQLAGGPSLGWGTAPGEAQRIHPGCVYPGSLRRTRAERHALDRTGPHRGQRGGTTDPQLSQGLILRVVFLQEDLGGLPERRRRRSGVHKVTPGSGQPWPPSPSPPPPGCTWVAAQARAWGLGGSGICG